jgi:hypothetical protein
MATIKINKTPYVFRYKISELNLVDYFKMIDILNTDEFETYEYKGKTKTRQIPLDKDKRTPQFIRNLYVEVLKYLSDIPNDFFMEQELVNYLLSLLNPTLLQISKIQPLEEFETKGGFILNHISTWNFNKWVIIETFTRYQEGELNQLKLIPTVLDKGQFDKYLKHYQEAYELFCVQEKLEYSLALYLYLKNILDYVRSKHNFIYNDSESTDNNGNLKNHNKIFGWSDTIRMLAEKGVFGTYLQVKEAPLLEVLEYLNISISHDIAYQKDMMQNNK